MRRWHLSAHERERIRTLTRAKVRQSEIARLLGITAPSVSKAQRAMGLPTRLVIPEKRILRLFRRGWGGVRISKHLGVPANQVYAVAHKNHFHRADSIGYPTPHGNIPAFIEAIKRREGYIKHLAKRYGVGFCAARRIAHEVLGTYRFRPGVSKPPLDSAFPQKWPTSKAQIECEFGKLAQLLIANSPGEWPPGYESMLVTATIEKFDFQNRYFPEAVEEFRKGLTVALQARIASNEIEPC